MITIPLDGPQNPTSHTLLLTCVSPAKDIEKKTVASLRYGQLFGKAPKSNLFSASPTKVKRAAGNPKGRKKDPNEPLVFTR